MHIQHLQYARHSRAIQSPNPDKNTACGEFVGLGHEGGTEKKEPAEGRTAHAQSGWQSRALNRPPGSRVHTKHHLPAQHASPSLTRLEARWRQEIALAGEEPPRVTPRDSLS